MKFPKIGMRIIKTAIAVFISISIYLILLLLNNVFDNSSFSPSMLYTPFFAAIASCYALHQDRKSSLNQAKIRSVGSLIGGYYGMIIILISEYVMIDLINLKDSNYVLFLCLTYLIVAIFLIPLIWFTVFIKQKTSVFITCLTYFSVTISIRNNLESVALFATNRVISTLIGIGIALLINNISLIRTKNKHILFVSSIDDNILSSHNNELSPYIKYKLNNLYYKDMPLTFITTRTMSTINYLFDDVEMNYPIIVMNGASIYDFSTNKYESMYNIDINISNELENIANELKINSFKYCIEDNTLNCFYSFISNDGEKYYYEMCRKSKFDNFVRAKVPFDMSVSLFIIISKEEVVDKFIEKVKEHNILDNIDIVKYEMEEYNNDDNNESYFYLKINSKLARKENLVKLLKEKGHYDYVVTCGSGITDVPVFEISDFCFCLSATNDAIKTKCDIIINDDPEEIFKIFDKFYHSNNLDKTIKKLKYKYSHNRKR